AAMRLLADDALAARMGAAAYEAYWADPPSPAAHAHALIALYREVLTRQTKRCADLA
ncbi:MAG: glycosyl transferase family 1, partial [Methylobacteriaceae bacterium]|nr:glycosyl transferase family 1 [Methylobacteriaceae bacterium]